jgi:hypothetical protein
MAKDLVVQYQTQLSDKDYWHGFIPFYEQFFAGRAIANVAEFGVFKGRSIRWLLERFPQATIYGADILEIQPEWPRDSRFKFTQLDQSSIEQIRNFLSQVDFDLIIEDGSHLPEHQINCLIEGLEALRSGGIYILEDVETSFSSHPWWNKKIHWWKFSERKRQKERQSTFLKGNALHLLLAIDHYQRINRPLDQAVVDRIAKNSWINKSQIARLTKQIAGIHLYRRSRLPLFCHNCGSEDFEFSSLKCVCGKNIFQDIESMSFVVLKK